MKKLVHEYDFSPEQLKTVRTLSAALGITEIAARILYARGMDTEEKMRRFLNPSRENFLSPYLMSGMEEAVALLRRAKEEEWRVAVFGDYDADGIGASAIMYRALKAFGIEPYLYVPEREEGYGLSIAAIDRIFDEFLPDLILTVDCGISCSREVEYIKEQGALVIVTDHHELPEILPDCICINPKLKDDYPYDNLCGAGVAFKLATALLGERANGLLDFCALSTVADSVPLLGENRDIVSEGLRLIEESPRPAFAALLGKQTEITAQTLAFTLVPRVNAAGRMGDTYAALKLFISDDEAEIFELAAKLNAYNLERQQLGDELYEKARKEIEAQGAYGNVIMLVGEDWNAGLIGIVAARIVEAYARPAILFVRRGNMLRGSARSIACVNIFEALRACGQYIEEFGGHSQAAGVNVKEENFGPLKEALNRFIGSHYSREDFIPTVSVCEELEEFPRQLALELNRFEPYGVGNRRPLFFMRAGKLDASLLKPMSPHVTVPGGSMEFMYFSGAEELRLLRSDVEKEIVFECNLSKFRGKESLKGFIRAVVYEGASGSESSLDGFEETVRALSAEAVPTESLTEAETDALIARKDAECAYGLCVIAEERESLARFPSLGALPHEVYRLSSGSVRNAVLLAPGRDCDLSAYREIVFLETPTGVPQKTGNARLFANSERASWQKLTGLDLSRDSLARVFAALREAEGRAVGETYAETARMLHALGFDPRLFVFALAVFEELGLVDCSRSRLRIVRGKRTDLMNSPIYARAVALGEKG